MTYTASGAEAKSSLFATEVAYGTRDDCFAGTPTLIRLVVSLEASRGRRLAFFDVVAAIVSSCCCRARLEQGRTVVLLKALHGTRKASRLWQRFLRDVQADADWKASVIFASMYTMGDQRGALGCWSDDLLVVADEVDLNAVEAHLMKRLAVKVLARIGGKSSGEAGVLGRVLRYDAATESFFWCVALDRPEIQYATNTVAPFIQSLTKSVMAKLKRLVHCLLGFPQAVLVCSRQGVLKYLDVYGDSDWAGDEERKRSTTGVDLCWSPARRCVGDAIAGRAVQRGGGVLRLQPRDRRWTANVPIPERCGLRCDATSVESAVPAAGSSTGKALGDPTHVDTGTAAGMRVIPEVCPHR